ncbi:MAG: hypothetical protein M3460_04520 [Actinomycetota bacterium]|nr:hypothetical protein [Actinomycetota bacterium]
MTSAVADGGGFRIGSAFVDVHARVDDLPREVQRGIDRATNDATVTGSAQRGGSGIGKSLVAGFAGGFLGGGLLDVVKGGFKSIVTGASDLQETINKSTVIFGQQAAAIESWAGGAARNVGMSKQSALEAAASFGNMFTQLGFTGQAAADMSMKVVQMSADLGSFNNLPTAQVADMISAAFRGEYDSLQALIPNINAARVESEALAMTGKAKAESLTASEKAAATLAIVERDSALATGDFARTSESLANQQKIASAQIADAAAQLGTYLLPALAAVAGFITSTVVPAIGTLTGFIRENWEFFAIAAGGILTYFIPALVSAGVAAMVNGAKIAAGLVLAMGPVGWIIAGITGLVGAIVWAWQNCETFRNIVKGAFEVVGNVASWLWRNMIEPAMRGIGGVVTWVWQTLIKPNIDAWVGIFRFLGDTGMWLWHNMIRPAMDGIGNAVSWAWHNLVRPVFDAMRGGVDAVGRAFQSVSDWIGRAWNALRNAVADPVRFMVHTVWNNGILRAWNAVVGFFGGRPAAPIAIPFATGGRVPGQGDSDTVPALLTPEEFVVRKGIAKHTLRFLEALNAGQPEAVQAAGGFGGRFAKFAEGGSVARGLAFARAQHGRPYIWGGVGPVGYDCSGFISAITNVLTGRAPHSRIGATGSMPWPGFRGGLNSLFGVGWFTGNPGHTAGTLAGSNVESGGSPSMTKFVQNAAGATHRQFNRHMSLPMVGGEFIQGAGGGGGMSVSGFIRDTVKKITDPLINRLPSPPPQFHGIPRGMAIAARDRTLDAVLRAVGFDSGGILSPGWTLARNATGRPEGVFTSDQLAELVSSARGVGPVTVNVTQTSGSPAETGRFVALALRTVA